MKPIINIILLFFFIFHLSKAQNSRTFYGYIADDAGKKAIPFAMVAVLSDVDSSFLATAQTSENGYFTISYPSSLPEKYILWVTHLTYKEKYLTHFQNGDTVWLQHADFKINKVLVLGDPPQVKKPDTITINVRHFRDSTEQKVDELLGKLPGINVDRSTGDVKVGGQNIETILLEGDDVTETNYKKITTGMPADAVHKVQILYRYQSGEVEDETPSIALNMLLDSAYIHKIYGAAQVGLGYRHLNSHALDLFYVSKKVKAISFAGYDNTGDQRYPFLLSENEQSGKFYLPKMYSDLRMKEYHPLNTSNTRLTGIEDKYLVDKLHLSTNFQSLYKWGRANKLYLTLEYAKLRSALVRDRYFFDPVQRIQATSDDIIKNNPMIWKGRFRLIEHLGKGAVLNIAFRTKSRNIDGCKRILSNTFISSNMLYNSARYQSGILFNIFKEWDKKSSLSLRVFGHASSSKDLALIDIDSAENTFSTNVNHLSQQIDYSYQTWLSALKYRYNWGNNTISSEWGYAVAAPSFKTKLQYTFRSSLETGIWENDLNPSFHYLNSSLSYSKTIKEKSQFQIKGWVYYPLSGQSYFKRKSLWSTSVGWNYRLKGFNYLQLNLQYGFTLPSVSFMSEKETAIGVNGRASYPGNLTPRINSNVSIGFQGSKGDIFYSLSSSYNKIKRPFMTELSQDTLGFRRVAYIEKTNTLNYWVSEGRVSVYNDHLRSSFAINPSITYFTQSLLLNSVLREDGQRISQVDASWSTVFDFPVNFLAGMTYTHSKYLFSGFGAFIRWKAYTDFTIKIKKHKLITSLDYNQLYSDRSLSKPLSTFLLLHLSYKAKFKKKYSMNVQVNNILNVTEYVEQSSYGLVLNQYRYRLLPRRAWATFIYSF